MAEDCDKCLEVGRARRSFLGYYPSRESLPRLLIQTLGFREPVSCATHCNRRAIRGGLPYDSTMLISDGIRLIVTEPEFVPDFWIRPCAYSPSRASRFRFAVVGIHLEATVCNEGIEFFRVYFSLSVDAFEVYPRIEELGMIYDILPRHHHRHQQDFSCTDASLALITCRRFIPA